MHCLCQILGGAVGVGQKPPYVGLPIGCRGKHPCEVTVGGTPSLSVADDKPSRLILRREVAAIYDQPWLYVLRPGTHLEWLCGVVVHTEPYGGRVDPDDG